MLAIYAYQVPWVRENMPAGLSTALGLVFYETIQPIMADVTVVVSWVGIVLLFATVRLFYTLPTTTTTTTP